MEVLKIVVTFSKYMHICPIGYQKISYLHHQYVYTSLSIKTDRKLEISIPDLLRTHLTLLETDGADTKRVLLQHFMYFHWFSMN